MYNRFLRTLCVLLLGAGVWVQVRAHLPSANTFIDPSPPASLELEVGQATQFDVSEMLAVFEDLESFERRDQIADLAVFGALYSAGLSSDELMEALYDKVPIREPLFADVMSLEYGPGRRILLPDGRVWLLYSAHDPVPKVTLARLADQVRMELGESPPLYGVFSFRPELYEGVIHLSREADLSRREIFSTAFGYHEATVRSLAEFEAILSSIDDITFIHRAASSVTLGGRRFPEFRTLGPELEDIAALYQAHVAIEENQAEIQRVALAASQGIIDGYNALVNQANARDSRLGGEAFYRSATLYLSTLSQQASDQERREINDIQRRISVRSSPGTVLERIRPLLDPMSDRLQQEALQEMAQSGSLLPPEPGFSLDPQWDVPGLQADFERLLASPMALVTEARSEAQRGGAEAHDTASTPLRYSQAMNVSEAFKGLKRFDLPETRRMQLRDILSKLKGKSGKEAEDGALIGFLQLKDALKDPVAQAMEVDLLSLTLASLEQGNAIDSAAFRASPAGREFIRRVQDSMRLYALLQWIEAKHRAQCARYDGPLQGTRVGMNLFYTDVMAKVWASVDYERSAPILEVQGFKSEPVEGPSLEATYWEEVRKYPSTRLWFGPKPEGYVQSEDTRDLSFAHVASRVYSAGSNPLNPGAETNAAEASRRTFGWWDRHFDEVANYEPEYHLQNQIMKWSVITGWLQDANAASYLSDVEVSRAYRFDRWYAQSDDLRYRGALRLLPESEWLGGTECMEILQSYPFKSAGASMYIYGGVSLGSKKTLAGSAKRAVSVPRGLRRAGVDYSASDLSKVTSSKKVSFVPKKRAVSNSKIAAEVEVIPQVGTRLRSGAADFEISKLTSQFHADAQGGWVTFQSNLGDLGTLKVTRSGSALRLDWKQGRVLSDQSRLSQLSQRLGREGAADEIASLPTMGARDGVYVVETAGQTEAILLGATKGSQPRVLALESKLPTKDVLQRSAEAPPLWQLGLPGDPVKVASARISPRDALAKVRAQPWQRVVARDAPGGDVGVARVFTDHGPGPGARPVKIKTQDPAIPEIEGLVDGQAVYLRRPGSSQAQAPFESLILKEGWSAQTVRDAAQSAHRGVPLPSPRDALTPGQAVAEAAGRGRYADAISALETQAQSGQLKATVTEVHALTQDGVPSGLTGAGGGGGRPPINRPALVGDAGGGPPKGPGGDSSFSALLEDLSRGDAKAASLKVNQTLTSRQNALSLGRSQRALGRDPLTQGVKEAAEARSGGYPSMERQVRDSVQTTPAGVRVHSSADIGAGVGRSRTLSEVAARQSYQKALKSKALGEVYVQDSPVLNQLDFDVMPGETLSRLAELPQVQWTLVEQSGLGGFRPGRLKVGEDGFRRIGAESFPTTLDRDPPDFGELSRLGILGPPSQRPILLIGLACATETCPCGADTDGRCPCPEEGQSPCEEALSLVLDSASLPGAHD